MALTFTVPATSIYTRLSNGGRYRYVADIVIPLDDAVDLQMPGAVAPDPPPADFTNEQHEHGDADSGGTLTSSAISNFAEAVDDRVDALIVDGDGITTVYSDDAGTLTVYALPLHVPILAGNNSLLNVPAAITEVVISTRNYRTQVDLTRARQVRTVTQVAVAGAAGTVIRPQYSTDESAWNEIGSSNPNAVLDATGVKASSWINLVAGAKAVVFLRLVTEGGDGAADPSVLNVAAQFR